MTGPTSVTVTQRVSLPNATAAAAAPARAFSDRLGPANSAPGSTPPVSGAAVVREAIGPQGQLAASIGNQYGSDGTAQMAAMLRVQLAVQKENQWFTTVSNVKKLLSTKPIADNLK